MKLKDILKFAYIATKIVIVVTFPYESNKEQYVLTDGTLVKKELLASKEVAPFLDKEVRFVDVNLKHDYKSETYCPTLNIFIWG